MNSTIKIRILNSIAKKLVTTSIIALGFLAQNTHATQCVKAVFGIGYVAQVDWYEYNTVVGQKNNVTGAFEVSSSTKPKVKSEKIAVGQESCSDDPTKTRTAVIRVVGGDIADWTTKIAAAGVGAVAGAAVCVATAGSGCGVIAGAIGGAVGGAAGSAPTLALPNPKEIFYVGAPSHYKRLELRGTIWNPKYKDGSASKPYDIPGMQAIAKTQFRITNNAKLTNKLPYKTLFNATIGACAFECFGKDVTKCKSYNYYFTPSPDKKMMFTCELFDVQAAQVCGTTPAQVMKAEVVNYYEKKSLKKKSIPRSCTALRDDG